jgi:hypothetical protein
MADTFIINYRLHAGTVTNPDGTLPATLHNCVGVAGPGPTADGVLTKALHFPSGASLTSNPLIALIDAQRFCVRLIFRSTAPVSSREMLFTTLAPACSLHLLPANGSGDFRVACSVRNARNAWAGIDSGARLAVKTGKWITLELAYDVDTLALFADDKLVAVTAFPQGALTSSVAGPVSVGIDVDGVHSPFVGDIALVQLTRGVRESVQLAIDDARNGGEWQLGLKKNTLLPSFNLGNQQGDFGFDYESSMFLLRFDNATIGYGSGMPAAYVIYGAIRNRWERAGIKTRLGALVSDESNGRARGVRWNAFERGAIYWSRDSGAWEVLDRPYLDYERMGGSISAIGLPVGPPSIIPSGTEQRFQRGMLYQRGGALRAYEVHGAIVTHYLDTGGPGTWGFPVSDEQDVLQGGTGLLAPPVTGAKQSRFERCTIFWSANTGAHEVHGAILNAYTAAGGAGLPNDDLTNGLGLPLSDEADIPAWAGFGRHNTFEHGSIVWNGANTRVCPVFKIKLGTVQTEEDEGWGQGENDLYFKISVHANGAEVFSAREPGDGSFGGDNTHDLDYLIDRFFVPSDPELRIALSVEVWDEDDGFGGGDDHLGTLSKELNISNAWGLFDNSAGIFSVKSFDKIKLFEWQVQPRQPPFAPRDFWETRNQGTPTVTYDQYAAAFTDIDDDPEWTDPSDWAQREVFSRRVKTIANGGNCFGMCVEALYAWFGHGAGLPLARFTNADWGTLRNEFNIKQISYIGSDALAHTHDQQEDEMGPAAIFQETRQRFAVGDPCAICMWQNSDYTGSGHCILPFAWDDSTVPWTITAFDPNAGNAPAQININPFANRFSFNNAGLSYSGAMAFVPWSAVDHRQCSPAWDPNLLLLALLIVVVGSDASTESITDTLGANLWMRNNPHTERRSTIGQFASTPTVDGTLDGEILVRRVRPTRFGSATYLSRLYAMSLAELQDTVQRERRHKRTALGPQPLPPRIANALSRLGVPPSMASRKLWDLMRDQIDSAVEHCTANENPFSHTSIDPGIGGLGRWLAHQSSATGPDFVHLLRGNVRGRFDYLTRWRLTATKLQSVIDRNELHRVDAIGLSGQTPLYRLRGERDKLVDIEHTVRLGRSSDFARIRVQRVPMRARLALDVALGSGLSSVNILTAGDRVEVAIDVEIQRGSVKQARRFLSELEGGIRLSPSFGDLSLRSAAIGSLFGNGVNSKILHPM